MAEQETELQMVRRHVREGWEHLRRQRAIVAQLRAEGSLADLAAELLAALETSQQQHEEHLARILKRSA